MEMELVKIRIAKAGKKHIVLIAGAVILFYLIILASCCLYGIPMESIGRLVRLVAGFFLATVVSFFILAAIIHSGMRLKISSVVSHASIFCAADLVFLIFMAGLHRDRMPGFVRDCFACAVSEAHGLNLKSCSSLKISVQDSIVKFPMIYNDSHLRAREMGIGKVEIDLMDALFMISVEGSSSCSVVEIGQGPNFVEDAPSIDMNMSRTGVPVEGYILATDRQTTELSSIGTLSIERKGK